MTINGIEITATSFAYDGCHKIYLIESDADLQKALRYDYDILPISELPQTYRGSCGLEFISNMSLTKNYVEQCETATFSGF
jgi:hypothetical protein